MTARVLVVDDHPGNLKLLTFMLCAEGYNVRAAADADEALAVVADFRPHLILMDVQLPGIDGLQLTTMLKADPVHRNALIVAVTASAMKGDEEKAVRAGCDGYITKPIDTRTLPQLVASFLKNVQLDD
jgi:CheY-like chemotaxis protein